MSLADVAYFRSMTRADNGHGTPVCHVFHPADAVCAYRCVELMAGIDGLCFLRTHRPEAAFLYALDERFKVRGCKQLREGDRLTLVSSGYMVHAALQAADALAGDGIACNVFDAYTFPMEASPILRAAEASGGAVLTIEDNFIGGLHAELAEASAMEARVRVVGMTVTRLPRSARTAEEELAYVGVGVDQIVHRARRLAGS
jgi:transketolase